MSTLSLEYRMIGLLPTCIGNERIRLEPDGQVYHSRNTRECDDGQLWSSELRPVGRLEVTVVAALLQQIRSSGVLALPAESVAETVEGGKREELDLTLDDAERHFVVQNMYLPAFREAVRALVSTVQAAGIYPS
jgi:hypothetical protein